MELVYWVRLIIVQNITFRIMSNFVINVNLVIDLQLIIEVVKLDI